MKWEVNSGVGMPGNGGYKKSKSKGEVSVSSARLIKTIDFMISYVHQCYVIVFVVSYRGITNSRFSLTQSKLCIF